MSHDNDSVNEDGAGILRTNPRAIICALGQSVYMHPKIDRDIQAVYAWIDGVESLLKKIAASEVDHTNGLSVSTNLDFDDISKSIHLLEDLRNVDSKGT